MFLYLKKNNIMIINIQTKHNGVKINNAKYFIVQFILNGNKYEVGYIQHYFSEIRFKHEMGVEYINSNIMSVREFETEKEYLEYKHKYADVVNF